MECGASMETRSQPSSLSGGQAEGNSSTAGSPAMYACTARRRHRNSSSGSRTASAAQCVSAARRRWLGCRAPARSTAASAMKHDILCALCTATHVRRCTKTICGTHPKCDPNSATEQCSICSAAFHDTDAADHVPPKATPDGGGCGSHAAPSSTPTTVARAPSDIPTISPGHRTAQTSCATPAMQRWRVLRIARQASSVSYLAAGTGTSRRCGRCLLGSGPGRGRIPATADSPAAMMVCWRTAAEARHRLVP